VPAYVAVLPPLRRLRASSPVYLGRRDDDAGELRSHPSPRFGIRYRLFFSHRRGMGLRDRRKEKGTKHRKRALGVCFILVPLLAAPLGALAFKQEDLDRVLATKQCTFCDLTGAQLSGADLSGSRLSGARLSAANLSKTSLSGSNLRNVNMHHTQLLDANLSNADLSGADLAGADLTGASLSRAKLSGADFSDANLSGTDLSEANLTGAYWVDGKRCKEGSIGECKRDSGQTGNKPGKARGSHGGMRGLPGGQ